MNKSAGYKPAPGYPYNPIFGYGRNYPCFCGSSKKFKKCCMLRQDRVVKKSIARELTVRMSKFKKENSLI